MTHQFNCIHCKHENKVKITVRDRGEYQMKYGDFVDTTCKSCHKKEKTHINKIYAVVSQRSITIGFVFGFILGVTLLFFLPGFLIISASAASIPLLIYIGERKVANTFNHYKIKVK